MVDLWKDGDQINEDTARDKTRVPLVVVGKLAGLGSNPFEEIVDERVHDAHGLGGDTGVGVHLLQDLVDVDGIGLLPPPLGLLVLRPDLFLGLSALLGGLSGSLGRHFQR